MFAQSARRPRRLIRQNDTNRGVLEQIESGQVVLGRAQNRPGEVLHDSYEACLVVGHGHVEGLHVTGLVVVDHHLAALAVEDDVRALQTDAHELGIDALAQHPSSFEDQHDAVVAVTHGLVVRL